MLDIILLYAGISGFLVLYLVLMHLSARMGEGMSLPRYYLLFYIAILFLIISLPVGWSIYYSGEKDAEDILFTLLTIGNAIAIGASFKYWWWLKDELWGEKEAK